ncbi:MAG: hypothetical protein AAB531_03635 [Patescibacteria group bacterium]
MIFLVLLFLLSLVLQGSVTTIPLVLVLLLNLAIATKKTSVFLIAFLCGVVLDIMLSNPLGQSSIFYLLILATVFLYERKFDVQTFPFVFISSFSGSLIYLIFFDGRFIFLQAITSALISIGFFFLLIQADRFHIRKKSISLEYEK